MATESVEYIFSLRDLFTSKIKNATRATNELEKSIGNAKNSTNGLGSMLSGAIAGIGVGFAAKAVVDATANMESLNNAIMAGSSNSKEGAENIKFIGKEVDGLGLDLVSTMEGFKTFQGAVKGTSLDGERARTIFHQVSQAVTAMGLTGDDAKGIFLAMGQMVSKGTVQAEELRGQLGERLPGAFQKSAKAMGVTTAELGKMMQRGDLLAEDLLPRLGDALGEEFGAKSKIAADGLRGSMNKMNTALEKMKVKIGNELMPVIKGFFSLLSSVFSFLSEHTTVLYALIGALGGLAISMAAAKIATLELNAALLLNPYVAIAAGIAVIVALMAKWIESERQLKEFREQAPSRLLETQRSGIQIMAEAGIKNGQDRKKAMATALKDEISFLSKSDNMLSDRQERLAATLKLQEEFNRTGSIGGVADTTTGGSTTGKGTKGLKTQISEVEGRKATNINVTIGNLIEQQYITAANLPESAAKIGDEVKKVLLTILNDVNLIAG